MIFPERVFGSDSVKRISSGVATGPMTVRTCFFNSPRSSGRAFTPDDIRFTESLPKTRSGKIMRRLLKQIAAGQAIVGDTTTLEDFSILAKLAATPED